MVDDHEELLSNSMARLERVRHKHERLSKILISVKAGVEHLQDKLKSTANEVSCLLPLQPITKHTRVGLHSSSQVLTWTRTLFFHSDRFLHSTPGSLCRRVLSYW